MGLAGLCIGIWLLLASPCSATTLVWMDVQALTEHSTSVLMGRVSSQRHLTDGPGVALNQITFEVSSVLKGRLEGTIVVNNPGFPGAPAFSDGDELVLFLTSREGTHVITGFQQGSFRIVSDASGRRVVDRAFPSRREAAAGNQRSLDRLVAEILDAAR